MKRIIYTIIGLVLAAGLLAGPWIDHSGCVGPWLDTGGTAAEPVAVGPMLDYSGVNLAVGSLVEHGGATIQPGIWEAAAAKAADLAGRVIAGGRLVAAGPLLDHSG